MHQVGRTALQNGAIGGLCGACSLLSYYIASDVVPVPYGQIESSFTPVLLPTVTATFATAMAFALVYMIALSALQRLSGAVIMPRVLFRRIAFYAALVQAIATFWTNAFTKTRFGWSLDQSISLPIAIAGATLPGLIVAALLQLRWRSDTEIS